MLESATPQEQMQILQHYIEVIELGAIDQSNKTGAYATRLFPELQPERGVGFGEGDGPDSGTPGPETTSGDTTQDGCAPAVVNLGRLGSHNRPESPPAWARTWDTRIGADFGAA